MIPNGVDTIAGPLPPVTWRCPTLQRVRERLGSQRIFLYMGRLATEKNVEALLRALATLVSPFGCRLVIVGDGPLRSGLMNQFR